MLELKEYKIEVKTSKFDCRVEIMAFSVSDAIEKLGSIIDKPIAVSEYPLKIRILDDIGFATGINAKPYIPESIRNELLINLAKLITFKHGDAEHFELSNKIKELIKQIEK